MVNGEIDKRNFRIDSVTEVELLKLVFQNVYGTHPNIEGINFMLRGDAVEEIGEHPEIIQPFIKSIFLQMPSRDPTALKVNTFPISINSALWIRK